jgi:hypothetical protein
MRGMENSRAIHPLSRSRSSFLEKLYLLDPSIALEQIEIVRVLCSEMSQDGFRVFVQKAWDRQRIIRLLH